MYTYLQRDTHASTAKRTYPRFFVLSSSSLVGMFSRLSALPGRVSPLYLRSFATRPSFPSSKLLESIGLPGGDAHSLPESTARFPDGGQYRIEIPSTEGYNSLKVRVPYMPACGALCACTFWACFLHACNFQPARASLLLVFSVVVFFHVFSRSWRLASVLGPLGTLWWLCQVGVTLIPPLSVRAPGCPRGL